MKIGKKFFLSALLAVLTLVPFSVQCEATNYIDEPAKIEQARVYLGDRRPFNWYYHYDYQYYYPRHHRQDSCYWIYSNGAYIYSCS